MSNANSIDKKNPMFRKSAPDEDEVIIQSYLSNLKLTDAYQDDFAALMEKVPKLPFPLDHDLSSAILDQKAHLLSAHGILRPMKLPMDEDGIQTPPENQRGCTYRLPLSIKLLFDMYFIHRSRKQLHEKMKYFKLELDEIQKRPYELMDIDTCGQELRYLYDYICRLSYCNYQYALFPGALLQRRCKRFLNKVNFTYDEKDLLHSLNDRYSSASKELRKLTLHFLKTEGLAEDLLHSISYEELCQKYPEAQAELLDFFGKYGFLQKSHYYCVSEISYYENPDAVLEAIREILLSNDTLEADDFFQVRLKEMKEKLSPRAFASFDQKVKCLRHFYIVSSELTYLWEIAFYYIRKVLTQISLLTTESSDYRSTFSFLFLEEIYEICRTGVLDETMRENICRRKEKRTFAEKIWANAKKQILEEP